MILKLKKKIFYHHKNSIFFEDVGVEKVTVPKKISSFEKTINTLLVTCIRMIKGCFLVY